jgi:hypothetical protein
MGYGNKTTEKVGAVKFLGLQILKLTKKTEYIIPKPSSTSFAVTSLMKLNTSRLL